MYGVCPFIFLLVLIAKGSSTFTSLLINESFKTKVKSLSQEIYLLLNLKNSDDCYGSNINLIEHKKLYYNKENNLILVEYLSKKQTIIENIIYKYTNNKITEKCSCKESEDENIFDCIKNIYTYNKNNEIKSLETIYYSSENINKIFDKETTMYFYKYDKYKRIIEKTELSSFKIVIQYKKFDDKGNWIEKIEFKNDQIEQYTKREIEYY